MKRNLFISLAVIVCMLVLFLYVSFNGNFITKSMAMKKIEEYVMTTYAGSDITKGDASGFNFKDASYYTYYTIDKREYSFSIRGAIVLQERIYTDVDYSALHEAQTAAFTNSGTAWLHEQLKRANVPVESAYCSAYVFKDLADNTAVWKPTLSDELRIVVDIELAYTKQSEEAFLQQATNIQQLLNANGLTYTEAAVYARRDVRSGSDTHSEVAYTTVFTPTTKQLNSIK